MNCTATCLPSHNKKGCEKIRNYFFTTLFASSNRTVEDKWEKTANAAVFSLFCRLRLCNFLKQTVEVSLEDQKWSENYTQGSLKDFKRKLDDGIFRSSVYICAAQ